MRKSGSFATAACAVLLASCGSGDKAPATPMPTETVTPDPVAMSFLPAEVKALGTEPFWNADITREQLTWTTPENLEAGGVTVPVTRADGAENVLFTATIDGQLLQILVTPGTCSDGMSDNVYPFTVERTLGEESVPGCADVAKKTPEAPAT